jgi:hypothetical protein
MMRHRLFFLLSISWALPLLTAGQCDPRFEPPLSPRIANYRIAVTLDHSAKTATAQQTLTWRNTSPDTLREMRFYMYLNAFTNTKTTFLKGSKFFFGEDLSRRSDDDWGWIRVDSIGERGGAALTSGIRYIQPDDGNPDDRTVLQVPLRKALLPGETLVLDLKFSLKMPKTVVRSGFSKDDFFLFVHWFPQAGVYEPAASGRWGWNCHQFFAQTEFYADFGVYDVAVTASEHLRMGATGCLMEERKHPNGTVTRRYRVEDVIDFAWVAYPFFEEHTEQWQHVTIRLLIPPEHSSLAPRYLAAVRQSLEYLSEHVGRYPYPIITVVDPPLHALRSGLMEYPTFITGGSFYRMPAGIRTMESLAIHEFTHQYFMQMLASNEKEEAWLDEGFVTYFEDRILDHFYGEKSSLIDLGGFRTGNKAQSRLEYTGLPNPKVGTIARPGWEFKEAYKGLVYSKTATTLQSLHGLLGNETMDDIVRTYFERWKFKHPRGHDFIDVAVEVATTRHGILTGDRLRRMFRQCLYETVVCDYSVAAISNEKIMSGHGLFEDGKGNYVFREGKSGEEYTSKVMVHRLGEMVFPVEVEIRFEDGSVCREHWSGEELSQEYVYTGRHRVVSAHVDPLQKIYLDLDLNNNSLTLEPKRSPLLKFAAKAVFWIQNAFQAASFLL